MLLRFPVRSVRTLPGLIVALCAICLAALAADAHSAWAQEAKTTKPQEVAVGLYLNRLVRISHKEGTFDIDAWIWFRWKSGDIDPTKTFEVVNGQIDGVAPTEVLDDGGYKYGSARVQGTIFQNFDVARYPFDNHSLSVVIEDSTNQAPLLRYVADEGSAIDPQADVEGWKVGFQGVVPTEHAYPTTYGFRSLGEDSSKFSRLTFKISLTREHNFLSLLKLFWVSFLALLLAIGACFVRSNDLDARFGLGLGSIFAASANTIAVSENLPDTPILTLAEQVNMLTVIVIFATIFVSIVSLRLRYAGRDGSAERLDFWCAGALVVVYPILLFLLLGAL